MSYRTPLLDECAEQCLESHRICTITFANLSKGDAQLLDVVTLGLLEDAADINKTAAAFLQRGSFLYHVTARACAEVSERCAAQCDSLSRKFPELRACADACWAAADSCRRTVASRPSVEVAKAIAT